MNIKTRVTLGTLAAAISLAAITLTSSGCMSECCSHKTDHKGCGGEKGCGSEKKCGGDQAAGMEKSSAEAK